MKEERYHIALDKYDKNIVINALNNLRNRQMWLFAKNKKTFRIK